MSQVMLGAMAMSGTAQAAVAPFDAVQRTPFGAMGVRLVGDRIDELVFLPRMEATGSESGLRRNAVAREACRQIAAYVADAKFQFELPLARKGTDFQRRVWAAISAIPLGSTRSYGELARELGSAPRAVGQACGANFFPLAIPCHRVVAAAGLGGFAHHEGGFHLRVKRWLLAHEAR
jgi:methylated-DNA-[protein]-cysteine S-methyltransferase